MCSVCPYPVNTLITSPRLLTPDLMPHMQLCNRSTHDHTHLSQSEDSSLLCSSTPGLFVQSLCWQGPLELDAVGRDLPAGPAARFRFGPGRLLVLVAALRGTPPGFPRRAAPSLFHLAFTRALSGHASGSGPCLLRSSHSFSLMPDIDAA